LYLLPLPCCVSFIRGEERDTLKINIELFRDPVTCYKLSEQIFFLKFSIPHNSVFLCFEIRLGVEDYKYILNNITAKCVYGKGFGFLDNCYWILCLCIKSLGCQALPYFFGTFVNFW
jgi:hypothetical protein